MHKSRIAPYSLCWLLPYFLALVGKRKLRPKERYGLFSCPMSTYSQIMNGSKLVFEMGPTPNFKAFK